MVQGNRASADWYGCGQRPESRSRFSPVHKDHQIGIGLEQDTRHGSADPRTDTFNPRIGQQPVHAFDGVLPHAVSRQSPPPGRSASAAHISRAPRRHRTTASPASGQFPLACRRTPQLESHVMSIFQWSAVEELLRLVGIPHGLTPYHHRRRDKFNRAFLPCGSYCERAPQEYVPQRRARCLLPPNTLWRE